RTIRSSSSWSGAHHARARRTARTGFSAGTASARLVAVRRAGPDTAAISFRRRASAPGPWPPPPPSGPPAPDRPPRPLLARVVPSLARPGAVPAFPFAGPLALPARCRATHETDDPENEMSFPVDWHRDFFAGLAAEFWHSFPTAEMTRADVDFALQTL